MMNLADVMITIVLSILVTSDLKEEDTRQFMLIYFLLCSRYLANYLTQPLFFYLLFRMKGVQIYFDAIEYNQPQAITFKRLD